MTTRQVLTDCEAPLPVVEAADVGPGLGLHVILIPLFCTTNSPP